MCPGATSLAFVDSSLPFLGEMMRGRSIGIVRAAEAATMLTCWLALSVPLASMAAVDPASGRASGSANGSASGSTNGEGVSRADGHSAGHDSDRGGGHRGVHKGGHTGDDGGDRVGSSQRAGSSKGRAADSQSSTSVGLRVLPGPVTPSPGPHPTLPPGPHPGPGHHGRPPLHGSGGHEPAGHVSSGHSDVSVDVDSDQQGGGRAKSHGHGAPPVLHPHDGHAHGPGNGHGHIHGKPHVTKPHKSHRGYLPLTGHGSLVAILSGTVAVLTGAILLWASSVRRKRLTRRNQA